MNVLRMSSISSRGGKLRSRLPRWAPLACLPWLALGGCQEYWRPSSTTASGSATAEDGPRNVVALGRLDPADGVISISAVPGERLLELNPDVREGGEVEPGARLGKLASYELRARQVAALNVRVDLAEKEREHELRVAAAQRNQALAAAAQAEAKLAELQAQRATLEALAEAAAIAREDLARLRLLGQSDPELVSSHELRRQENATARAESESMAAATAHPLAVTAAQRALEAAQANVTLAEQAYAQAQAVNPTLAIAAERDVADEALRQSELFAPGTAGDDAVFRVLKVLMQPGEFVTQLPIVQIADVRRMACVAEVFEADVAELTVGQAAIVRSKALSPPYREQGLRGTVRSIGTLVSNPDLENRNPLAPVDRSVVEVVIDLDPQDAAATAEAASKLGLQVTVEFLTTGDATPAAGAATGQP